MMSSDVDEPSVGLTIGDISVFPFGNGSQPPAVLLLGQTDGEGNLTAQTLVTVEEQYSTFEELAVAAVHAARDTLTFEPDVAAIYSLDGEVTMVSDSLQMTACESCGYSDVRRSGTSCPCCKTGEMSKQAASTSENTQ